MLLDVGAADTEEGVGYAAGVVSSYFCTAKYIFARVELRNA